jgi:hypothetical protein
MSQRTYSLKEFSQRNWDRNVTVFTECNDWTPQDYALAAVGPVGYIGLLFAKRNRGETVNDGEIFEEIADAVIYLDLLCTNIGGDLSVVLRRKFNATSKAVGGNITLPGQDD